MTERQSGYYRAIAADTRMSPIAGLDLIGAPILLDGKLADGSRPTAVPNVAVPGVARYAARSGS